MENLHDTIVALATPSMQSALALIRLSGNSSFEIMSKVFDKKIEVKERNKIIHGHIIDNKKEIDDVVIFAYKNPYSFTGEDLIEISCHGGLIVINKIISLLISKGARMAERGEFSKRAFYNGKIDLLQAESINDLIVAKTSDAASVALSGVDGKLSSSISELKKETLDILSHIEVNIDYPEYDDIEELTNKTLKPLINNLKNKVEQIVKDAEVGSVIKNGINVAIIGRPNVGKSSILNTLIKEDKAIVSEYEGTTRDIVEGSTIINGICFNFLDTAGIRKDAGFVEKIGIDKAKDSFNKADLILLVTDQKELNKEDLELKELIKEKKYIEVYNKVDLTNATKGVVISAANKQIEPLIKEMVKVVGINISDYQNKPLLSSARQKGLMEKVKENLNDAIKLCDNLQPIDIIEIDIKEALNSIQELLGEVYKEHLDEEIFKRFCLGK